LFDYKGSINALLSDQNSVSVFTDLGNGNSYGTATVAAGPIQQFTVLLSAAAIADLNFAAHNNPADTRFAIGGSLLSISGPFANEQLFAIFGPQTALTPAAELNLVTSPVPEPATWALLLTGFGAIGFVVRRRRNAAMRIRFA
jgi:hypothetical protein